MRSNASAGLERSDASPQADDAEQSGSHEPDNETLLDRDVSLKLTLDRMERLHQEIKELFDKERYQKAEEQGLKLIEVSEHLIELKYRVLALDNKKKTQKYRGKYQNSLLSFEQILSLQRDPEHEKSVEGVPYRGIGSVNVSKKEYEKAIDYLYKKAKEKPNQSEEREQGQIFMNLAISYNGLGHYTKAIEFFEKSLEITRRQDDMFAQGRAHNNLASSRCSLGYYRKAIENAEEHLDIALQLNDMPEQGRAYCVRGRAQTGLGQYKLALTSLNRSKEIAEQLNDREILVDVHEHLGNFYYDLGVLKRAVHHYLKLMKLAEEDNDIMVQCSALSGLGRAHLLQGDMQNCSSCFQKELKLAQMIEHRPSLARAYSDLGRFHMGMSQFAEAIECHEKDKEIFSSLDPGLRPKRAHGNLGDVHLYQGDYEKAIEHHELYLELAKKENDKPAQAQAYASLGLDHLRQGRPPAAFRLFAMFESVLISLETQLIEGELREHLTGFIQKQAGYIDTWVVAASKDGDMREALRIEEWRRCRSELPYLPKDGEHDSSGNTQNIGAYREVTTLTIERIGRNLAASFVVIFKLYDDTLMTWVLSGETGKIVYGKTLKIDEYDISKWVASATFTELNDWFRALRLAKTRIENKERNGQPLNEEEIKHVVEETIPTTMKGVLRDDLWESIRNPRTFREMVFERSGVIKELRDFFFELAERDLNRLDDLLFEPIITECQIYFLPDSALSPIPFGAFRVGDRHLIEVVVVSQASSLRTLEYAQKRWNTISKIETRTPPEALVVSGMNSRERQLFENDLERLNKILPAETPIDDTISKDELIKRLTSGSASLIHFTGHRGAVERDEHWAGVYLPNGAVLSARDLQEGFTENISSAERRRTTLLVLCACSSGRGSPMSEGVHGFARAASVGGIPCLLASKWNVPIRESIVLMTALYAYMAENKSQYLTVAEALQAAVKALLARVDMKFFESFYYWAAFIPHGFADTSIDNSLLDQIHNKLERLAEEIGNESGEVTLEAAILILAKSAYHRLELWE